MAMKYKELATFTVKVRMFLVKKLGAERVCTYYIRVRDGVQADIIYAKWTTLLGSGKGSRTA